MAINLVFFAVYLVGFIFLAYSLLILIKRRGYENKRIMRGYYALLSGIGILAVILLIKGIKYGLLSFNEMASTLALDFTSQLILLPIFGIAFIVGMLFFQDA